MVDGRGEVDPASHEGSGPSATWRDERRVHLLTRGNVDGILSAAFYLARMPEAKVSYVTSSSSAVEVLRRDLSSREFHLVDLGLTPKLAKTLNMKVKGGADVTFIDHHQQSPEYAGELDPAVELQLAEGASAAAMAHDYLGLNGHTSHLAALADFVEYCPTVRLRDAWRQYGKDRIEEESRVLDFSWRLQVEDDRFRVLAARKMAFGAWPSEVPEILRRYLQVKNEGRWERALERIRQRVTIRHDVAVLDFGRRKPSLFGFGSRALVAVAKEEECRVALLINRRRELSSVSMRGVVALDPEEIQASDGSPLNLGRFVDLFTKEHGVIGGGHPQSAGAKIPTRCVPLFLKEIYGYV